MMVGALYNIVDSIFVARISENALIFPAFLFGSTGAMLGMIIFNHKTSKIKFRICIPLSVIVNILTVYVFAVVIGR